MAEWIISSSVLILLVIAMRYFFRRKLAMRAWYALWLVVAVRLLVPVSFAESSLSILNLFRFAEDAAEQETGAGSGDRRTGPDGLGADFQSGDRAVADTDIGPSGADRGTGALIKQAGTAMAWQTQEADSADLFKEYGEENGADTGWLPEAVKGNTAQGETGVIASGSRKTGTLGDFWKGGGYSLLRYLWLLGAVLFAGSVLFLNVRYRKRVCRSRKRYKTQVPSRIPVYVSAVVDSPCMFGLRHPAVYLNTEAAEHPETLGYVLCHENVHYRHHDNLWVAVRAACLCLHWYNPLVWIAAALSEQDGELACDERTLELLGQEARIPYGRALLEFSARGSVWQRGWKLSTAMSSGKKLLKERLLVIVGEPRKHAAAMAVVLFLTFLCGTVTFTGKVSGKEAESPAGGFDSYVGDREPEEAGPGYGQKPQNAYTESSAIVPIDLNGQGQYALKVSGEAVPGSGEYKIRQIQLNRIQDREEEAVQIIRPEDVRVLYTRSLEDIRNDDGQMYSYALKGEPLYAKPLRTVEDLPSREAGKFLADKNGELFSDAPDGRILVADLNFDGYEDFCIQGGTGTVNIPYYCYLWNPREGRFDPGYMIPNVEVDKEARLVRSATDDGDVQRSVKYYRFDESNLLHMVRYVEENQSPGALFPKLDLTYCELQYTLPAVDEWDYGTAYGGALPQRFVYWAKEALRELYEWSGTKIEKACFSVSSFGNVSFANTPEELKASLIYFDRGYGSKAGFESIIEQITVSTERTVWFSPVIQWNKPDNQAEMLDIQLAEWYFERSPLSQGEKLESVERTNTDVYVIKAESGKYYQIFLSEHTREMSAMYGPYEKRPD
ncbi:MAG: hypothetical protein HFH93_01795 [Lachnospiraceae bacterium]|nr:hypothetical protein [Lachnospiraceae bacterium]